MRLRKPVCLVVRMHGKTVVDAAIRWWVVRSIWDMPTRVCRILVLLRWWEVLPLSSRSRSHGAYRRILMVSVWGPCDRRAAVAAGEGRVGMEPLLTNRSAVTRVFLNVRVRCRIWQASLVMRCNFVGRGRRRRGLLWGGI